MRIVPSGRARIAVALGLSSVFALALLSPATASSHREAPLITEDPVADNTDTYAFVSPDDPDSVTLIANWIPFEEPAGGPNFYNFGEDVLYQIKIDNDGDAVEDIVYEWRFRSELSNPTGTFLYNTGPITSLDDEDWNLRQFYTLSVVNDGVRTVLGQDLPVPPNNVGARSTPNYDQLATDSIRTVSDRGGDLVSFAGQRDEAFPVDLGSVFDLAGLRPFNMAHAIPLPTEPGKDATAGFNVHTIALQVPIAILTDGDEDVIGVWSSTDRRRTRVFAGGNSANPVHSGPFVQVSRLGMPLVNEVVIPIGAKDVFNTLLPSQDGGVLTDFPAESDNPDVDIPLLQDPELARLITALYGIQVPPPPRDDVVEIFLTGIDGLNQPAGVVASEMIRLNTATPVTPLAQQNRMGLLGGDMDGFPNGRRLVDDVVDIELQVLAGATPLTPEFNVSPNNQLGDGVPFNDKEILPVFPYIPAPHSGYDNTHTGPATTNSSVDGS